MSLPELDPDDENELEPSPKWIRALLDGRTVVDSRQARMVRPPSGPPRTYAFPPDDVDDAVPDDARMQIGDHVAVRWSAMDHWYEEDEEVFIHPRDPDKRIDTLRSSRHVRVERDGEVLAESHRPTVLIESFPQLPVRYYLRHQDVDQTRLRPNDKVTGCPYKGWASYYDVKVGDQWHEDLVWTYLSPLREVEPIRGLLCFWNERTDIIVDGEPDKSG